MSLLLSKAIDDEAATIPRVKVLIIDDDGVILQIASWKLKSAGYEVITATDGSQAIQAISEQKPEVILVDLSFPPDVAHGGIPSWDGFRLMLWLRGWATAGTRFIIISSSEPTEDQKRTMTRAGVAFLQKPIDFERLLELIENELKRSGGSNGTQVQPARGKGPRQLKFGF